MEIIDFIPYSSVIELERLRGRGMVNLNIERKIGKQRTKPEIYILLTLKMKPREILKLLHVPQSTVYYYSRNFKRAIERLIKEDIINSDWKIKKVTKELIKQEKTPTQLSKKF